MKSQHPSEMRHTERAGHGQCSRLSESQERAGVEEEASEDWTVSLCPPIPGPVKAHPSGKCACGRQTSAWLCSILSHEGQCALACLCLDVHDHNALEVLKVRPRAGRPRKPSPAELTWGFVQIPFLLA